MDLVFGILTVLNCNALNVDETCLFSICARKLITTNGLSLRGCPNVGFPAGRSLVHWWFLAAVCCFYRRWNIVYPLIDSFVYVSPFPLFDWSLCFFVALCLIYVYHCYVSAHPLWRHVGANIYFGVFNRVL